MRLQPVYNGLKVQQLQVSYIYSTGLISTTTTRTHATSMNMPLSYHLYHTTSIHHLYHRHATTCCFHPSPLNTTLSVVVARLKIPSFTMSRMVPCRSLFVSLSRTPTMITVVPIPRQTNPLRPRQIRSSLR